jgi:hypothetical protein
MGRTPTFVVKLRPASGTPDEVKVLRLALKVLWRRFGLRCVEVTEEVDDGEA